MSKSKYCNNYTPPAVAGEAYMKGGRIKLPPHVPPPEECRRLVNAMVQQGLVKFPKPEVQHETDPGQ